MTPTTPFCYISLLHDTCYASLLHDTCHMSPCHMITATHLTPQQAVDKALSTRFPTNTANRKHAHSPSPHQRNFSQFTPSASQYKPPNNTTNINPVRENGTYSSQHNAHTATHPSQTLPSQSFQPGATANGLAACAICLGRHAHTIARCTATKL